MAVMAAIVGFTHLLAGFDNPTLVRTVTTLLGCSYTSHLRSAPAQTQRPHPGLPQFVGIFGHAWVRLRW